MISPIQGNLPGVRIQVPPRTHSYLHIGQRAPVRVLTGPSYEFDNPSAVAVDAARVWIANSGGNSPTELNAATGAPVRVLTGPSYEFDNPSAVAVGGARVWIASSGGDSVTEFPASPQ
jgi:hypothetical protein